MLTFALLPPAPALYAPALYAPALAAPPATATTPVAAATALPNVTHVF